MSLYKDTRINGKLVRLEDVIDEVYNRALKTIDDGLYELLVNKDDDEFYEDYKEAFPLVIEMLQKFHDGEED
jgi:hypothetical protein